MRPGQRLGQYELICQTAQGGMASIWLARATGSRGFTKVVAIKTMLPGVVDDPDAERMFLAEAAVASRIEHPNVVQTLDLYEEGGLLYLVMEWVRGEALSTVYSAAAARGGMPLGIAVRVVSQVAAGLHAAHELADASGKCLGLVHRDVSPHNVLVGFNGVVKLVDFGIAKLTAETRNDPARAQELRGKVAYMAPEQIRLEPIDRRTDVFATGVLLYLLTTGIHPFKRANQEETALAVVSEEPAAAPSKVRENYPARLERVVLRALSKRPEARYATAREFGEDLLRALPPFQGVGHDEIRAYMRDLLPAHFSKQQELVRLARDVQDAAFASAPVSIGQVFKQSGRSSSTLRAVAIAASRDANVGNSTAPPPAASTPSQSASRPRHGKAVPAFLGAGLLAALGLVALTRSPGHPSTQHAASAEPTDVQSAAPPSATQNGDVTRELHDPYPQPADSAAWSPQPPAKAEAVQLGPAPRAVSKPGRPMPKSRPGPTVNPRKNGSELKEPY